MSENCCWRFRIGECLATCSLSVERKVEFMDHVRILRPTRGAKLTVKAFQCTNPANFSLLIWFMCCASATSFTFRFGHNASIKMQINDTISLMFLLRVYASVYPELASIDRQSTTNKSLISRQEEEEGANPIRTICDPLCVSSDYGLLKKKSLMLRRCLENTIARLLLLLYAVFPSAHEDAQSRL